MNIKLAFSTLFLLCFFSGCKVGPDYYPPSDPMPVEYREDQKDKTATTCDENLFRWWRIFNDPYLDQLLEEAIHGNFDYRIALEKVCQARSQYWIQVTQLLPELVSDAQASRFRTSQSFVNANTNITPIIPPTPDSPAAITTTSISPIRNFFQVGFDAIWEIDFFGGLRRSAASAYDTWEATVEDARAVKLLILSETANTYAIIRGYQRKIDIAVQTIELNQNLYRLAEIRFKAGLGSEQDYQTAYATVETDKANLLELQTLLKVNIYSLGVLIGRQPESLMDDFQIEMPIPYSEDRIPVGLPADLLRRRPDIRSAERNLAAATEQIGVAVAELFPKVSLTGSSSSFAANPLQGANIGYSSDKLNKLFKPASRVWGIGGIVTFPVFDWGNRLSGVRVQASLEQQAYLNYQKIVVTALQEVEQALLSYFNEQMRVQDLNNATRGYARNLQLVTDQFEAGLIDFTQVLIAQQFWLNSENAWIDSQQALTTDLIAIYKAMGGDW
jgi:multidrug efflux system outer membrane protein